MRTRFIVAGALAAALTLPPAAANAAGTVGAGPVKVKGGYAVSLHAVDKARDTLTIMIQRGTFANGTDEMLNHTRGVKVVVTRRTASIKGSLGSRGTVNLVLRNGRVERSRKRDRRCTGTPGTTITGRLEGKLRLRLPNGKMVTIRSFPASAHVGGTLECLGGSTNRKGDGGDGDGNGDGGEPRLMLSEQRGDATLSFIATKRSLQLYWMAKERRDGRATYSVTSGARASGSNLLTVSGGGSSAGVKSAKPFTGNGAFTAVSSYGSVATGPLTGSLKVKLAGVPVISIAGENAMLLDGDKG